ncbi:DUF6368 family protein [Streptomyces sp. NPDC093675]|uniref:DUF6368 family protein n=1 Tax=Streptomyces TaxID=1883 RepID=UPI003413089F
MTRVAPPQPESRTGSRTRSRTVCAASRPDATEAGGCAYSHVGDRAFLTAWLDHPEFRMIK